MLSNVESEFHHYKLLTEVTDHKRDDRNITNENGFIKSINGNLHWKRKNCSCKILVEWKYGSFDWVPLKYLKQSNPVELAEYSMVNEIIDEPVFSSWVKDTLRRQDKIISKVKSKYWRTSHTFVIRVLKTVKEAYEIDRQSVTEFWTKEIAKEMENFRIALLRSLTVLHQTR